MNVFLAGCEDSPFTTIAQIAGCKYYLFSYFHWLKNAPKNQEAVRDIFNKSASQVICDSGLFTLMFGVGKGRNYDMPFMVDYTKKYIAIAKQFGINNLTIVESDVHKLLGMSAVYELRKYFEDSGLPVLYVWHVEEGIDGLIAMANKYDYIALSVPELRIFFKEKNHRYQDAVKDLLLRIRKNTKVMPKVHLLGNTITETMETTLAYSCDSSSWLAGGRWGKVKHVSNGKFTDVSIYSKTYSDILEQIRKTNPREMKEITERFCNQKSYGPYMTSMFVTARSFVHYQEYLDRKFPWINLKGTI